MKRSVLKPRVAVWYTWDRLGVRTKHCISASTPGFWQDPFLVRDWIEYIPQNIAK